MTARRKDDWGKPRKRSDHLTADEINFIRRGLAQGMSAVDIARELKCASRTVSKYFSMFGDGSRRRKPKPVTLANPRAALPLRHYRSDFEA